MTKHAEDDITLAGEYALGLLEGAARDDFETRLSRDPDLRDLYAQWAEYFALLEDDSPATAMPPKHLYTSIETRLFGKPRKRRLIAMMGGLGVIFAAMFAWIVILPTGYDYQGQFSGGDVTFEASYSTADQSLRISGLEARAPDGHDYELWIIPEGGAPQSLGIIQDGQITLPDNLTIETALLAVTLEPAGGSPTGQPTTTPILAGPLVKS